MVEQQEKPPERLWKYRTWDKEGHTRAMITRGELYFPRASELNDPFEFRWRERIPNDPKVLRDVAIRLCQSGHPDDSLEQRRVHVEDYITQLTWAAKECSNDGTRMADRYVRLGVFCLATHPDDILMWSHYAKNHSGVCVGICTQAFRGRRVLKVHYRNDVPVLDIRDYVGHQSEVFVQASLNKADHWAYEQEWRTIHLPGPKIYPQCVDRVVIGALAPRETKAAVHDAVAEAGYPIGIFQAKLSTARFGLDIEPTAGR